MRVEADQQLAGLLKTCRSELFEHMILVLHDQQMRHHNGWQKLTARNSLPKVEERIRDENNNERCIHAKPNTRGLEPAHYQKE